jgi:uncharacterized membrane protein
MQTSLFLAQLIGPALLVMGLGMIVSPADWRAMAEDFLASPALIFVAGLLALVPGLAIVLPHNVWALDWRLIITVFGWLATVGGAFRILAPRQVKAIGGTMLARSGWMRGGGAGVLVLGAILSFFGYRG